MPRRVNPKGNRQAPKRYDHRRILKINYKLLLADIQSKSRLDRMTDSEKNQRRHRHCLL